MTPWPDGDDYRPSTSTSLHTQESEAEFNFAGSDGLAGRSVAGKEQQSLLLHDFDAIEQGYQASRPPSRWNRLWCRSCSTSDTNKSRITRRQGRACAICHKSFLSFTKCVGKWLLLLLAAITLAFFVMLGVMQFVSYVLAAFVSLFPGEIDHAGRNWTPSGDDVLPSPAPDLPAPGLPGPGFGPGPEPGAGLPVMPIACHSHNDYWRAVPLHSALQAGCISVEADVWLFDHDLYIGHTASSLMDTRTLRSLYLDPLTEMLTRKNIDSDGNPTIEQSLNGVFEANPSQSLVLLIDFKTTGEEIWPYLVNQLSPLRDRGYLTHYNGTHLVNRPITVVASGNAPFHYVVGNGSYTDIFYDAPLADLVQRPYPFDDEEGAKAPYLPPYGELSNDGMKSANLTSANTTSNSRHTMRALQAAPRTHQYRNPDVYDRTNSYYASVSFRSSIGFPWRWRLSNKQLSLLRSQIQGAHKRGLKVRYYGTPSWPHFLRNHIWRILVREGVDVLNIDDLRAATRRRWGMWNFWEIFA